MIQFIKGLASIAVPQMPSAALLTKISGKFSTLISDGEGSLSNHVINPSW
jgi:hypothetical protein